MVVWFGVSISSSDVLVDALIHARVKRFAVVNFGRGLLVGVDGSSADEFGERVVERGGRARALGAVDLPPAVPLRLHEYPVSYALRSGGVLAKRVGAGRFLAGVYRYWNNRPPRELEEYVFSAARYNAVFKAFVFGFSERGARASKKLSGKIARLKPPLLVGLAWSLSSVALTPKDLVNLTSRLVEGGMFQAKPRFAELVEDALGFSVPVADGLSLEVRGGLRQDANMLVVGAPGTGKSLFVDWVLERLSGRGVNVVVLDPTGEHAYRLSFAGWRVLVAGKDIMLNPVALPRVSGYDVISGTLSELWREEALTPIQSSILQRALEGASTLLEVVSNVEKTLKSSSREDELTASSALLRRLRPIIHPALLGSSPVPGGRVVIDLGWIDTEEAKRAFVLTFLYSVYGLATRGEWSGIIVVDEADRFSSNVMDRIADELRKYNVSLWAVGHSVARIPPRLRDARWTFIFGTKDPDNLAYAGRLFPEEIVERVPYLGFGQAVFFERGRQPQVVSVYLSARKGYYVRDHGPTLYEVARKYNLSELELARQYVVNMDIGDSIVRFAEKSASPEDVKLVRSRGLEARVIHALAELYGGRRGGGSS
jgi:hypothetical protein